MTETDLRRKSTIPLLDSKRKSALGQFMTARPLCQFLASLFDNIAGEINLLDPGAGVGSLTAAFVERAALSRQKPRAINVDIFEIEDLMRPALNATLDACEVECQRSQIAFMSRVKGEDFILDFPIDNQGNLFRVPERDSFELERYSHVIMNPPYKKIAKDSEHRKKLSEVGIETSNLYSGFVYLAAKRLQPGGELVAIIPRSFCNGPYFKPFRKALLETLSIKRIHVFASRDQAFKEDEVLQENIIFHAIKGEPQGDVLISTSQRGDFVIDEESGQVVTEDLTFRTVSFEKVVRPDDPDQFIHVASDEVQQAIVDRMATFRRSLADIGVKVSTGPVVDFRHKPDLRWEFEDKCAPLLFSNHFQDGGLKWPKEMKKPNAIAITEASKKWLWPNKGHFVLIKRFSSKEEPRRIVASVYEGNLHAELIGFENSLNVFHAGQTGMPRDQAFGLSVFLNSGLVDKYFRQFNGHTQVNATDLRSLGYPHLVQLEELGRWYLETSPNQADIDNQIEKLVSYSTKEGNPILFQEKIENAISILKALGMPKAQQNERSALTLLALGDIHPESDWTSIAMPMIGITPIMDFAREIYGRAYAPNTRETFRRQTMHQLLEAGIVNYNPDDPARAVNSPKACYQLTDVATDAIRHFGSPQWENAVVAFLEQKQALSEKYAMHREMQMIPLVLPGNAEIKLTPGAHSELIRDIVKEFGPRFAKGSDVIYIGDTGSKVGHFDSGRLAELGVKVDSHGKLPDVVLYDGQNDWLLLIESVTSHGPVDAKRYGELSSLFGSAKPGIVYVTAFPDRSVMSKYLKEISWETEVWCADAPTHLIHFNGDRYLGPH